jgi:protein involved in polysaccharide export with SLBB domain
MRVTRSFPARRLQVAALVLASVLLGACALASSTSAVPAAAPEVQAAGAEPAVAPVAEPGPVESGFAEGYLLGIGDRISVIVLGEKDLSMEVLVNGQGSINYPFLGEIRVAGLTVNALRDEIEGRLKPDYLLDPQVTVQVLEYRKFFVNGEVQRPGGFAWQPGITVRKAAALAGGFTQRASRSRLFIIRDADADKKPVQVDIDARVAPGDILTIDQSFF